jgi:hypothetical protein
MAKVSKKQLRHLNQRAGGGVIPSVHAMTTIVLKPQGGLPERLGEAPRSRGGLDQYQKGTRSWINANILRPWDREA